MMIILFAASMFLKISQSFLFFFFFFWNGLVVQPVSVSRKVIVFLHKHKRDQ